MTRMADGIRQQIVKNAPGGFLICQHRREVWPDLILQYEVLAFSRSDLAFRGRSNEVNGPNGFKGEEPCPGLDLRKLQEIAHDLFKLPGIFSGVEQQVHLLRIE